MVVERQFIVFVACVTGGIALVGALDRHAADATAAVAHDAFVRGGFDPYRDRAPADCVGRQWVAHSSDAGPWIHSCLDIVVPAREVSSWQK